jgi:hypothetical protein
MEMDDKLEVLVKEFNDKNRNFWGNDSYSAGYLAGLVIQLGKDDKKLNDLLVRWFTQEKELQNGSV